MTKARVELPPKLIPLFKDPLGKFLYRGSHGGRGSGKSFTFAKMAAIHGYSKPLRILCCREIQDSIKDSFHAELKKAIASEPWLQQAYDVGENYLKGLNGTEFIFKGLRHNISTVKSLSDIDICIVEEAEDVPEHSWEALDPTIREHGSEMWPIWNPKIKGSPVDRRFRQFQDDSMKIVEMNYRDNPWFIKSTLEAKRRRDEQIMDPEKYAWIWDGAYYENHDALVFKNKFVVSEFKPAWDWNGPYDGLDFGFSNSPTAAIRCWIYKETLYIEYDAGKVGLELDETTKYLQSKIEGFGKKAKVIADSARPESISYLKRNGMTKIEKAEKGKGSVEDGIENIKSFKRVVIHPRCTHTIFEFKNYSFKIDKITEEVLDIIVDEHNHWIDALRYALERVMKKNYFDDYESLR